MQPLVHNALLPLLGELTDAREPTTFLARAHALLETLAPHQTAVAWCGMQVSVLGDGAQKRRDEVHQVLREAIDQAGLGHQATEDMLPFIGDSWLAGGTLMAELHESNSSGVKAIEIEALRDLQPEHVKAMLDSQGWQHALIVPLYFAADEVCSGVMLYRTAAQGSFAEAECAQVESLRPLLTHLLARLLEHWQHQSVHSEILDFLSDLPVGLILCNSLSRPLFINEEGYRQTQLWLHAPAIPPSSDARTEFRLPLEIREAAERLCQRWLSDALGIAPARSALSETVSHPLRNDMKATVTIAQSRGAISRSPGVLIRYSGMAARVDAAFQPSPAQLSILSQLTPGERNVALLVKRGMSNLEIAKALHRDVTTVKDHLSHIYDKLGIRGRTLLAAMLAG